MASIYVNTNYPIKTSIWYGGQLTSPDNGVLAKIYDVTEDPAITPAINPGTMIFQTPATAVETDGATYQLILPLSFTTRPRQFRVDWVYTIAGEQVTSSTHVEVVTPYCDIIEAIEYMGFGTDPSDPNYHTYYELMQAEKYARKVIETYCGQSFYLYDDVQVVWGNGTNIVPLPFKLASLHELYEEDILLVDNINNINNWTYNPIISETGFGLRIDMSNMLDNTVYIANGLVPPTINDNGYRGAFKKDVRYRIQGRFGWAEVPENVEEACMILMQDFFSKDSNWKNKYINRISAFDWNFEYFDDVFRGTGNLYVDQLLQPYVVTGMVVI